MRRTNMTARTPPKAAGITAASTDKLGAKPTTEQVDTTPRVKDTVEHFGGHASTQPNPGSFRRSSPGGIQDKSLTTPKDAATKLYNDAKQQLELSGNIKSTIKIAVAQSLDGLYSIIRKLQDERKHLLEQVETLKSIGVPQIGDTEDIKTKLDKILGEVCATRDALVAEVHDLQKFTPMLPKMDKLLEDNSEHTRIVSELKRVTTEVRSELQELSSAAPRNSTYAETLKGRPEAPTVPMHSIIVSSSDGNDSSEEVISKVRAAVDAKTSGIRVDAMRKARDQKIVIGCQERCNLEKIKEKLKKVQPNLKVEEAKNKNPLIILKDVLSVHTDEDILAALINQNEHLIDDIPAEDREAEIRYRRKSRNQHLCHVVIRVSPKLWQKFTTVGKLHIDLQRVVVEDQTPLIQCSICLGYGHGRKLCKETQPRCSHCGELHMRAECPALAEVPSCLNCQRAKNDRTDHNSFDRECPVRKRWDAIARRSVAYWHC